jgi:hypothetical protein
MNLDALILDQPTLRGTDSNTVLRMFDLASGLSHRAQSHQERARADKAPKKERFVLNFVEVLPMSETPRHRDYGRLGLVASRHL